VAGSIGELRPGQRVELVVSTPRGDLPLQGAVAWKRLLPPALQSMARSGFGVRLVDPPEAWLELTASLARTGT
jgi:hypothetical protein